MNAKPDAARHADEESAVLISQTPQPVSDSRPRPVNTVSTVPGARRWKLVEERLPGKRIRFKTKMGPFDI